LVRCQLIGADIQKADLANANLQGANLSFAKNLTSEQILAAQIDHTTKLPKNLRRIQEKRRR